MEFEPDAHAEAFRLEVRAFFDEHLTPERKGSRFGHYIGLDVIAELAEAGILAAAWPADLGGTGTPWTDVVLAEESERAGMLGPRRAILPMRAVNAGGTDEQKAHFLKLMLTGAFVGALGYTEPDSGSDAAAAKTRAIRDGDEWVINGQKMFTTGAQTATHVLLLTRTNLDVPKRKGLTLFMVPMDTKGIEVRPLELLGPNHSTTMTFYQDVRVPDSARIGDVDGGWSIVLAALAFEHGVTLNLLKRVVEEMMTWASTRRADGTRAFDDPLVRERLARVAIDEEVSQLLTYRNVWVAAQGTPGPEANGTRLFMPAAFVRASESMLEMVGREGVLHYDEEEAPAGGYPNLLFRDAPVWTIFGGSAEIHRDIIAERRLGLPRTRP